MTPEKQKRACGPPLNRGHNSTRRLQDQIRGRRILGHPSGHPSSVIFHFSFFRIFHFSFFHIFSIFFFYFMFFDFNHFAFFLSFSFFLIFVCFSLNLFVTCFPFFHFGGGKPKPKLVSSLGFGEEVTKLPPPTTHHPPPNSTPLHPTPLLGCDPFD